MNSKSLMIAYLLCLLAVVLVGGLAIGRAKSSPRIVELTEVNY